MNNVLDASSRVCPKFVSETKDNFEIPEKKKTLVTRSGLWELYLRRGFYASYLKQVEDRAKPFEYNNETLSTEYFEAYIKKLPKEDLDSKKDQMSQYPLYGSCAITVYNREGEITKDFKKRYSITRPINEQTEQFG